MSDKNEQTSIDLALAEGLRQGLTIASAAIAESLLCGKIWPELKEEIEKRGGKIYRTSDKEKWWIVIEERRNQ